MFPHEPNAAEQIGDTILLWTTPSYEFNCALVGTIPWQDRDWDLLRQCWIVKAHHYEELRRLVKEHLGYMLVVA